MADYQYQKNVKTSGLAEGFDDERHLTWREGALMILITRLGQALHESGGTPDPELQLLPGTLRRDAWRIEGGQF